MRTVPFSLVLDDAAVERRVATDLVGSLVSNVPAGSAVLLVGRACSWDLSTTGRRTPWRSV
ncbi:MAG: hypothetical protein M5T61_17260 [Acidimicrobiia bacterium]|nr:hypothetical protein [Acidimicrobiia bacterium]